MNVRAPSPAATAAKPIPPAIPKVAPRTAPLPAAPRAVAAPVPAQVTPVTPATAVTPAMPPVAPGPPPLPANLGPSALTPAAPAVTPAAPAVALSPAKTPAGPPVKTPPMPPAALSMPPSPATVATLPPAAPVSMAPGAIVVSMSSAPPPAAPMPTSLPPPPVVFALDPAKVEEARRNDALRSEARALLAEALEEALAPIHYAMRDLERRVDELQRRAAASPAPPGIARTSPAPMRVAPPVVTVARLPSDPLAPIVVAAKPVEILPARSASLDFEVPFDGKRRQRRVKMMFGLFLLLLCGGLVVTLIRSYMP